MARQKVVQCQCDRCKRVELQPDVGEKTEPELVVTFGGKTLSYHDLCTSCRGAIGRLIDDMREWNRELTQKLLGPAVQGEQAPPVAAAPNYSPPSPHKK